MDLHTQYAPPLVCANTFNTYTRAHAFVRPHTVFMRSFCRLYLLQPNPHSSCRRSVSRQVTGFCLLLCFVFNVIGSISMNLNVFEQTCPVEPRCGCRIQKSSSRNQLVMPEQSDVHPMFVFFTFCCSSPDLLSKGSLLESLLSVNIHLQLFGRKPLTTDAAQVPKRSAGAAVISRNIFGF